MDAAGASGFSALDVKGSGDIVVTCTIRGRVSENALELVNASLG
jgi:hypothetical protein